ncbi:hypothetical protein [Streptomyces tanashiensis]|nr:hypothetical protein [Streptomyces tanashiensis]
MDGGLLGRLTELLRRLRDDEGNAGQSFPPAVRMVYSATTGSCGDC